MTDMNGITFSNGMKVYFQGTVTPEKYAQGEWYVEGVGDKIELIPESTLDLSSEFASDLEVEFDLIQVGCEVTDDDV